MPTPSKPVVVLANEKKSHRTKKELANRKAAEQSVLTGTKIKEQKDVKENAVAHTEFKRLIKLLNSIGKNDAIYEQSINRYCMLLAECQDYQDRIQELNLRMSELRHDKEELGSELYYQLLLETQKTILSIDRQLQAKRNMLLALEKENIMTIASALRSIPKKAEAKANPLKDVIGGL